MRNALPVDALNRKRVNQPCQITSERKAIGKTPRQTEAIASLCKGLKANAFSPALDEGR